MKIKFLHQFTLICFFLAVTPTVSHAQASVLASDSLALVAIYNALDGPNWSSNNWFEPGLSVSEWDNIVVENNRVVSLSTQSLNPDGKVPAAIASLTGLKSLSLINNSSSSQITSIPDEIGALISLNELRIYFTDIKTIPSSIGNLTSLTHLYIFDSHITELPEALSQLTNLIELNLDRNLLRGSVPSFLGNLSSLETLSMSNNFLTGTIPASFNNLENIRRLEFQRNVMSSPLPAFSNTQVMATLDLENNRFSFADMLQSPSLNQGRGAFGDEQKYRYKIDASNPVPQIGESFTIGIEEETDNEYIFEWYKNGQVIEGATSSNLSLNGIDQDDNGIYYCKIRHTEVSGTEIDSESFVLDVNVTQRRYANEVLDFSGEFSSTKGAAIESLGLPNSLYDMFHSDESRSWEARGDSRFIELKFDEPLSINTIWVFSRNTVITSVAAKNPESSSFEVIWTGIATSTPTVQELNFPTTSFPVDEVRIEMSRGNIDAVAIGTNQYEINPPQNLQLLRLSDQIIDLSWVNLELENPDVDFIIERSVNTNNSFVALDTIGFARDYSDRNLPDDLTSAFYRVRGLAGSDVSSYSNTASVEICPSNIPTEGTWTGVAYLGEIGGDEQNPEVVISEVGQGIYEISDFLAFAYVQFNNAIVASVPTRLVDNCGQIQMLPTHMGEDAGYGNGRFTGTYDQETETLTLVGEPFFGGTIEFTRNAEDPVPNVPDYVTASQTASDQVFVQWRDLSPTETGFIIERSVGNRSNYTEIGTVGSNEVIFLDQDVAVGTRYYYRVRAENTVGISDPSESFDYDNVLVSNLPFAQVLDTELSDISRVLRNPIGYWADVNGDEEPDLFVPTSRPNNPNLDDPSLLDANDIFAINNSGGFSINSSSAFSNNQRESTEAAWTDVNNDGLLDILIQSESDKLNNLTGSLLYLQDEDSNFELSQSLGDESSQQVVGDMDNDGFLDFLNASGDLAFNSEGASFDIVKSAYTPNTSGGFVFSLVDYDNDGFLDINNRNELFRNIDGSSFELVTDTLSSQGWADLDNDGNIDMVSFPNLVFNDGNGTFTPVNVPGATDRVVGLVDYNNDGWVDIIGYNHVSLSGTFDDEIFIFKNNGDRTFTVRSLGQLIPRAPSPFTNPSLTFADYDGDGYQDFFAGTNSVSQPDHLFRNLKSGNNYIDIKLEGILSNHLGIGSKVIAYSSNGVSYNQFVPSSKNGGGDDLITHVGLKKASIIDSIKVVWPSGLISLIEEVGVNQKFTIKESDGSRTITTADRISSNKRRPKLTGRINDRSASVSIEVEGEVYPAINNLNGSWSLSAGTIAKLSDGFYDVAVTSSGFNGITTDNTTNELFIDGTAPVVAINQVSTDNTSPEITGSIDDPEVESFDVIIDGISYSPSVNQTNKTWRLAEGVVNELSEGTYDIMAVAIDSLGNEGIDDSVDELTILPKPLGLDLIDQLSVYPNPVTNLLTIESDQLAEGQLSGKMLDVAGNVVWKSEVLGEEIQIDVSQFRNGVYFLQFFHVKGSDAQVGVYKILVK